LKKWRSIKTYGWGEKIENGGEKGGQPEGGEGGVNMGIVLGVHPQRDLLGDRTPRFI